MSDSGSEGLGQPKRRRLKKKTPKSCWSGGRSPADSFGKGPIPMLPEIQNGDIDSIDFISSPMKVWNVISKFDEHKRRMVESIGFGGLLELPKITEINKPFCLWLISRLRWFPSDLAVSDDIILELTADKIAEITGLSCSGTDITDTLSSDEEKEQFVSTRLAFLCKAGGMVQAAEYFVQSDFPQQITKQQSDHFKVAFVIFVMGSFLTPKSNTKDGNSDFWGALKDADAIGTYNWSSYVRENIRDGARLVNWMIPEEKTLTTVSLCTLIVQVFYLDSIDFGVLNIKQGIFPRWKHFNMKALQNMVQADMCDASSAQGMSRYGKIQELRKPDSPSFWSNRQSVEVSKEDFTPIADTHKYYNNSASKSNTILRGGQETSNFDNNDCLARTIFNKPPCFENEVLDFAAFVRSKFKGKVDERLLNDLRMHNARCLQHIAKSYRDMAASIVRENANLAVLCIQEHNLQYGYTDTESQSDNQVHKRKRYKEIVSESESTNEGDKEARSMKVLESMKQLKDNIPVRKGGMANGESSTPTNHGSLILGSSNNFGEVSAASVVKKGMAIGRRSTPTNHGCVILGASSNFGEVNGASVVKKALAIGGRSTPTNHGFLLPRPSDDSAEVSAGMSAAKRKNTQVYAPNATPISSSKMPDFTTPEPTIMMNHLKQELSPTTENKIFSGACVSLRILESVKGIDLNAESFEAEYNGSTEQHKVAGSGGFSPLHWTMKIQHRGKNLSETAPFFSWLSETTNPDLGWSWIIHNIPRFLEIKGIQLKEQFTMNRYMSFDVFDIAIRRMRQLDKDLYSSKVPLRWRHLIESDYAMHVLGDEKPLENKSIREQFVGQPVDYDITSCRMFFIPVFVEGKWWCYAWDLQAMVVFIIDPTTANENESITLQKHSRAIDQLAISLTEILKELYTGWLPKFIDCRRAVLRTSSTQWSRNESGIVTLFCIWSFDGDKVVVEDTKENVENFKKYLLYEMMAMKENNGRSPNSYVQILD